MQSQLLLDTTHASPESSTWRNRETTLQFNQKAFKMVAITILECFIRWTWEFKRTIAVFRLFGTFVVLSYVFHSRYTENLESVAEIPLCVCCLKELDDMYVIPARNNYVLLNFQIYLLEYNNVGQLVYCKSSESWIHTKKF